MGCPPKSHDTHHKWSVEQFRRLPPPLLSCEAVVAETCFLLKRSGFDPSLPLQFIERGVVQLPFVLQEQIGSVSSLFKRYENVPGPWWIGWVDEVPGVNAQEQSREALLESLRKVLREALEFNRQDALEAAGQLLG
jgi:hypothetical protein